MQNLVFQPDPPVGYLHSWAYCVLLADYFREGSGRKSFGEWQDIAVQATAKAEKEIADSIAGILPPSEFEIYKGRVHALAEAHPISSYHLVPDIAFYVVEQILSAGEFAKGFAAATEMNEMLHDFADGGPIMIESSLKHARWMGELAFEKIPEIISEERQAIMDDMHQESRFILEALDKTVTGQRGEIFKSIAEERIAILNTLRKEREIVLATLAEERALVLSLAQQERMALEESIQKERIEILAQFESLAAKVIEDAEARSLRIIDRVFLRIVQIFAIPFVVIVVLLTLGFRSLRKTLSRPPSA
jgi:hypothetical protein